MSLPRFVLVACCSLVAARVAATDLLLPGDYHGDEIAAEDGTTWFALVQDDHGGARLEPRRVGIESVNDPVLDAEDGATGKRVGAGQQAVSGWETGDPKYSIGVGYAMELCRVFDVSLDWIYRGRTSGLTVAMEQVYTADH